MGRKLKKYLNPVLLDFFITKELLDNSGLKGIDIALFFNDIIENNKYTLGEDKSNDVINETHYHYRAYVKYTRSGVIKQITNQKLLDIISDKSNSRKWSLQSKPLQMKLRPPTNDTEKALYEETKKQTIADYFGYAIKDTIISTEGFTETEVAEMHSRASTLYKFKLDKSRAKNKNKTQEIMEHLEKMNPLDYVSTCREIVKYAIVNEKRTYLTKNYLKTTSLFYLGKTNKISIEELTELILSI